MSHTMDNNNNNNNNNNNGDQVLNFGVGCSAKRMKRKYLIDLNESYHSPDYSQAFADGCHMATEGYAKLQNEVQQPTSDLPFLTAPDQRHAAEEEQVHVQNVANEILLHAEILRARKGKMPMNYAEGAPPQEHVATDEAKIVSSDEQQVPITTVGGEGSSIGGMILLQHDDTGGASGSCPQRKRKNDFSEYNKTSCTRMGDAPKVVVRVESNVDIVHDGYRWLKYGCKEIKGNHNYPRGYYRCKTKSCNVKKQVERDTKNPKYVIASYEGKHNHGLPIITQKIPTNSSITTTTVVHGNASMPSAPFALPITHPLTPSHHYGSYGSYGMNFIWPNNNPFLSMVSNHMVMPYGFINGQHFLDCYVPPSVATYQVVPGIGGFPISPSLPQCHDFSPLGGYNIDATPIFPFSSTTPIDQEANNVPNDE